MSCEGVLLEKLFIQREKCKQTLLAQRAVFIPRVNVGKYRKRRLPGVMAVQSTVKSFLKARHIEVPDEWITACVEWIQSENPGLNVSLSFSFPLG